MWVDARGREDSELGDPGGYLDAALSLDGKHVAVVRTMPDGDDLWLVDTADGRLSRFTFHPGSHGFPHWSRDSKQVAYGESPIWSADGKEILYGSGDTIMHVPFDGGAAPGKPAPLFHIPGHRAPRLSAQVTAEAARLERAPRKPEFDHATDRAARSRPCAARRSVVGAEERVRVFEPRAKS